MAKSPDWIAEALGKAHARLTEDLNRVEAMVRSPSPPSQHDLSYELTRVRRYLTEHFRFEEQNGYMDGVRQSQPRFERTIEHLYNEHRDLAQSLGALIAEAEATRAPDDPFRAKVLEWISRLRRHEMAEDGLVQEAFTVDIGTKD